MIGEFEGGQDLAGSEDLASRLRHQERVLAATPRKCHPSCLSLSLPFPPSLSPPLFLSLSESAHTGHMVWVGATHPGDASRNAGQPGPLVSNTRHEFIWAYQFGETGLSSAQKLMDLDRTPSTSSSE